MRFALLLALALPLCAQPKFEVASIKPAARPPQHIGLRIAGNRVEIGFWSITQLVMKAYGVEGFQVRGPEWIQAARFDISANMPAGAKPSQVPEMLRALLEERFALKTHRVTEQMQGFAMLAASGGIKMTRAEAEPLTEGIGHLDVLSGDGKEFGMELTMGSRGTAILAFTKAPMPALAQFASSYLRQPVSDQTNLKGGFAGRLQFTPSNGGPPGLDDVTLPTALTDLGLRLESRKVPVEILVVDSASRTPTEN